MAAWSQRRVAEVVTQHEDSEKVLLLYTNNSGLIVSSKLGIKAGDIVEQHGEGPGRPVTHVVIVKQV